MSEKRPLMNQDGSGNHMLGHEEPLTDINEDKVVAFEVVFDVVERPLVVKAHYYVVGQYNGCLEFYNEDGKFLAYNSDFWIAVKRV